MGVGMPGPPRRTAPDNIVVRGLIIRERDVPSRVGSDGVDRRDHTGGAGHEDQPSARHRRRGREIAVGPESPPLLAGLDSITSRVPDGRGDHLCSRGVFVDQRRRPRWMLVPLGAPHLLARLHVERQQIRLVAHVDLEDHQVLINDRRTGGVPLVARVEVATRVEVPQVLGPQQGAVQVVAVDPFGAEPGDDVGPVGGRCLVGVRGHDMASRPRRSPFRGHRAPSAPPRCVYQAHRGARHAARHS